MPFPLTSAHSPAFSPNKKGRTTSRSFHDFQRLAKHGRNPDHPKQKCHPATKVAQAIAQGILRAARKGNVRAAAEIADRVEGKVSQDVNLNLVDYRKIAEEARKRVENGE